MAITVQCPNPTCHATYSVAETYSNRNVKCKRCGSRFVARPTLDERTADTRPNAPAGETFTSFPADFGRYRVLRLLGRGGMGSVYLAEDSTLGRRVALKLPSFGPGDAPRRAARFVREARSAAVLHHPNICTVFDAGEIAGRPFISMAYVEGQPLDEFIDQHIAIPQRRAAEIARRMALALAHAHHKGVVHRDLKPANVILSHDGEPVVTDFGLAKRLTEADVHESKLTKDGSVLGTPSYMSPEQVRGEIDQIGPATDIYALGVILFEMLAGRAPYKGTMGVIMGQILAAPVPLVTEFRPGVDARLVEVCRRAMAKDAAERHTSMNELAHALGNYLNDTGASSIASSFSPGPLADLEKSFGELTTARRPLPPKRRIAWKPSWSQHKIPLIIGGSVISLLLIVAIIVTLSGGKTSVSADGKSNSLPQQGSLAATDQQRRSSEQSSTAEGSSQGSSAQASDSQGTSADTRSGNNSTQNAGAASAQDQSTAQPSVDDAGEWITLFDGNGLDNWVSQRGGPPKARLMNDYLEIIPGAGNLMTKNWYGPDYELEFEFYIPTESSRTGQARGNSGIYLNGRHEIQILDSHGRQIDPKKACGALYDQVGPSVAATRPAETWQKLRIVFHSPLAGGPISTPAGKGELTVVLNGTTVINRASFDKASPGGINQTLVLRGPILLQDHNSAVRFRNIRVRPFDRKSTATANTAASSQTAEDFISLLNGRDLTGWTARGGPTWSWKDGRVVGSGGGAGFLIHEKTFDDFELQLEYRLTVGAGSGVFLRADFLDNLTGSGQLEVQIIDDAYSEYVKYSADRLTGSVFGVFPRKVTPSIKRTDWNKLRLRLDKRHIQIWVNGFSTVDANLDDARDKFTGKPGLTRRSGRIALQQNQQSAVEFRDIKVRPLNRK